MTQLTTLDKSMYDKLCSVITGRHFLPFIGPGINISLYQNLSDHLVKTYFANERIQDLVGVPCTTCLHSARPDIPKECPLLENVKREDCPPYREQILAVALANIRVLSQSLLTSKRIASAELYEQLSAFINKYISSNEFRGLKEGRALPSIHDWLTRLIKEKSRYKLIVTTNVDDSLEQRFTEDKTAFNLVFFDPDGNSGRGDFVPGKDSAIRSRPGVGDTSGETGQQS